MINALAHEENTDEYISCPLFSHQDRFTGLTILSQEFSGKPLANSQFYYSSTVTKVYFVIVRSFS